MTLDDVTKGSLIAVGSRDRKGLATVAGLIREAIEDPELMD